MSHPRPGLNPTPEEQAVYWVFRRHSGDWRAEEQAQLDAWLAESDLNRRCHARAVRLWNNLDQFGQATFPARTEAMRKRAQFLRRRRRRRMAAGMAIAASIILAIRLNLGELSSGDTYRTALGERRAVTLADGSEVMLNTQTELRVQFAGTERRVLLERGEAYFTVVHDGRRPFRVLAGQGEVRDIGTRFDVRMEPESVAVVVDEGEVELRTGANTALRLTAGQRSSFDRSGHIGKPMQVTVEDTAAWRTGQLICDRKPLGEVLAELGRHHAVQWEYADPSLQNLKLTGSFSLDDLSRFLTLLQASLPVTAQRLDEHRIRISRASR